MDDDKHTLPPDPDEALMRARFAAPDSRLLERLTRENAELRRRLELAHPGTHEHWALLAQERSR